MAQLRPLFNIQRVPVKINEIQAANNPGKLVCIGVVVLHWDESKSLVKCLTISGVGCSCAKEKKNYLKGVLALGHNFSTLLPKASPFLSLHLQKPSLVPDCAVYQSSLF